MVASYLSLAVELFSGLFSGLDFTVYNGTRMVAHWPERIEEAQRATTYIIGGIEYERVRWGQESDYEGYHSSPCPDCGVLRSQYHVICCDMERCAVCDGQVITCECDYDEDDGDDDE